MLRYKPKCEFSKCQNVQRTNDTYCTKHHIWYKNWRRNVTLFDEAVEQFKKRFEKEVQEK